MLTLFHAPMSRSTRVVQLIREMGIGERVEIRPTDIPRRDGTGARDPANPHPEGKVPALVHDGVLVRETNAIMLYLTDLFPESPLGRPVGHPRRGAYLSWLFWYGNVAEPVFVARFAGLSHPMLEATFRGPEDVAARLAEALTDHAFLVDDDFSAADLLIASVFGWFPDALPDQPAIRDWAGRCLARPAAAAVIAEDQARMETG